MRYPYLSQPGTSRLVTDCFGGLDLREGAGEGSFVRMENLTSDRYPLMAVRGKRGVYARPQSPGGLIARDALCYVDGSHFVINGNPIDLGLSDRKPKRMVSMGAYVLIFPDKVYLNTGDLTDYGPMEAEFTTQAPVRFSLCDSEGRELQPDFIQSSQPEEPFGQALWVDTGTSPHGLHQWSESAGLWVSQQTTYVKISSPGIGGNFRQYDGVNLTGLSAGLRDSNTGLEMENAQLGALEGAAVIWHREEDAVVIVGILDEAVSIEGPVTLSRKLPEMDFVTQSGNRLFGCRYGLNSQGQVVNEIYASKLGDFRNWNCFMGLSTDSYSVSLGDDGPFTGAVTHLGYPLFFRENCMHKLYGSYPANFQLQTTPCRGVGKDCGDSLAIVGEVLYYRGVHGFCAYDGSLPRSVSQALGAMPCCRTVAGAWGSKYVVSQEGADGWEMLVLDTGRMLWHREDGFHADAIAPCGRECYAIDHDSGTIVTLGGSGEPLEEEVCWSAQTGKLGLGTPEQKYVSRLTLRLAARPGAKVRLLVRYDGCDRWQEMACLEPKSTGSFSVPFVPRRCDWLELRLEGRGDVQLYSLTRTMEKGSELP